jgi:hypothetical protein
MQRTRARNDENGAILILALVFLIIVTLAIFGLITFGGVGILNSTNLKGQNALEYAADGATSAAVQAVRYSDDSFNNPQPLDCLPDGAVLTLSGNQSTTPSMTINGDSIAVDCIAGQFPASTPSQISRIVNFYACSQTPTPVVCTANNSVVAASVEFEDESSTTLVDQCNSTTTLTCGTGEVIISWVVETADS